MSLTGPNASVEGRPTLDEGVGLTDLLVRYSGASATALKAVLCPLLLPLMSLDKTILRLPGEQHYRATFTISITSENETVLVRGRTGKFVGSAHASGAAWKEVAKGRIISVDNSLGVATGEIYFGSKRSDLQSALKELDESSLLEIDQFGASAKVLSGLAEYYLMVQAEEQGYSVRRMPEDMAKHLGSYANYDFEFTKDGQTKKVEVKSLWGTDTSCARLIHSVTKKPVGLAETWTTEQKQNYYPTSSCKFATQDIFAVSLFLRTGNIQDFAFARSVARSNTRIYGLPIVTPYPEHVTQNPPCVIGNGSWFGSLAEVWNLP